MARNVFALDNPKGEFIVKNGSHFEMDTTGHTWIDSTGVISISSGERVSLGSTVHLPAKTMLGGRDTSSQYEQARTYRDIWRITV